jgi:amino acid permease
MITYLNVRLSSYRYEQEAKKQRSKEEEVKYNKELAMKWLQWDREVSCRVSY